LENEEAKAHKQRHSQQSIRDKRKTNYLFKEKHQKQRITLKNISGNE
jgi:hypothetical protein